MLKYIVLLGAVFILTTPAKADNYSALELLNHCEELKAGNDAKAPLLAACVFFISGAVEAVGAIQGLEKQCMLYNIPEKGYANEQLIKIFVKYANENPEQLHYRAISVLTSALMKAFPCEANERK